jgi:hypothetical protein
MKIKPEHLELMRSFIDKVWQRCDKDKTVEAYRKGEFPRAEHCKDRQMRFCFDVFNAAQIPWSVMKDVYAYANDEHILTALKKICPKL